MGFVKVSKDKKIDEVADAIETNFSEDLVTIKSADDIYKADQGVEIIKSLNWIISVLAIIIGGMIIANTMLMSVFERTREIGVLRAVGWSRHRVVEMIISETIMVSIMGLIVGTILGIIAVISIINFSSIELFIDPSYHYMIYIRALITGAVLAILGGLYPAYRASKLSPIEALRYE
jgi:putative ABC transport system permease protein